MPTPRRDPHGIPDRITIKTQLTRARVDNYYRELRGMDANTWLKVFSPAQRYEAVLNDLLSKLERSRDNLDTLEGMDD